MFLFSDYEWDAPGACAEAAESAQENGAGTAHRHPAEGLLRAACRTGLEPRTGLDVLLLVGRAGLPLQGGRIIYFGESFSVSMDKVNNFLFYLFYGEYFCLNKMQCFI